MDNLKENLKVIEHRLNNYNFTKESIYLLPKILEHSKEEVNIIETALTILNQEDRKIIEVLCIENRNPKECEEIFNKKWRNLYKNKNAALKKLFRAIYGIN